MSKYTVEVQTITTVARRFEVEADDYDEAADLAKAYQAGHLDDAEVADRITAVISARTAETDYKAFVRSENAWGMVHWTER